MKMGGTCVTIGSIYLQYISKQFEADFVLRAKIKAEATTNNQYLLNHNFLTYYLAVCCMGFGGGRLSCRSRSASAITTQIAAVGT